MRPKVHYRVYKSAPLFPILCPMHPIRNLPPYSFKTHFKTIPHLRLGETVFLFRFLDQASYALLSFPMSATCLTHLILIKRAKAPHYLMKFKRNSLWLCVMSVLRIYGPVSRVHEKGQWMCEVGRTCLHPGFHAIHCDHVYFHGMNWNLSAQLTWDISAINSSSHCDFAYFPAPDNYFVIASSRRKNENPFLNTHIFKRHKDLHNSAACYLLFKASSGLRYVCMKVFIMHDVATQVNYLTTQTIGYKTAWCIPRNGMYMGDKLAYSTVHITCTAIQILLHSLRDERSSTICFPNGRPVSLALLVTCLKTLRKSKYQLKNV
jgi:hypothetical protein